MMNVLENEFSMCKVNKKQQEKQETNPRFFYDLC